MSEMWENEQHPTQAEVHEPIIDEEAQWAHEMSDEPEQPDKSPPNNAYQIANLIADLLDEPDDDDLPDKIHRFTPSVLATRGFIGIEIGEKQYLITIEEV